MDEAEILGYEFTKPNCSESWLANPNNSHVLTTQYSPDLDANSTRGYTITVSTSLYCGQEPCSSTGSFLVFPNETFRVQILPPPSEKLLNSFTPSRNKLLVQSSIDMFFSCWQKDWWCCMSHMIWNRTMGKFMESIIWGNCWTFISGTSFIIKENIINICIWSNPFQHFWVLQHYSRNSI